MLRNLFLSITLMLASIAGVAAGRSTVTVAIDSVHIIMGGVTTMHVNIVTDGQTPATLVDIPDVFVDGVELHSQTAGDTVSLGSGRIEIKKDLVLQSFDSGLYVIPPVKIVAPTGETIASNTVTLKVYPVNVDSLVNIHPYADVSTVDRKLLDYVPDWVIDWGIWILLVLAVIAIGIYIWYKWLRRGKVPKPKKVEPPYNVAIRELGVLREEHLCEMGREKEYYTRLTEILRVYLDRRFGINAMEMTSSQIIDAIRSNSETSPSQDLVKRVLEIADFVKFAKVRPLPADNTAAFESALQFVEDTKPVERPETPAENNASQK
ncbi:MAG: cell wall anchor protein [Muribaculaceae bacterium]|nr:cell wall anchor protein [Muribaculaceae bacterium]